MKSINNLLVSIIITTYNRDKSLKNAIDIILLQDYKNIEIIVTDDGDTDIAKKIVKEYNKNNIIHTKNKTQRGYLNNLKNGINICNGNIITQHSDDDEMVDTTYLSSCVEIFKNNMNVDIVFGRFKTLTKDGEFTNNYKHKAMHTGEEFVNNWINIMENITFSTICFKKELFEEYDILKSVFPEAASTDFTIILKAAAYSRKIAFVDKIGYAWKFSSEDSLSGKNYDDLAYQSIGLLTCSIDMHLLSKQKDSPIPSNTIKYSINQYTEYMFNTIIDNYMLHNNKSNFTSLTNKYDLTKKPIYIYGKGKLGIALNKYLKEENITTIAYIDDNKEEKDIIKYETFLQNIKQDVYIIIGTYKYKYAFDIYKKLSKFKNFEVLDLFYEKIG